MSKVKFGFKNVHLAPFTTAATREAPAYGTPFAVPGAVSFSPENQEQIAKFFADNHLYYTKNVTSSIDGDLVCALLPEDYHTQIIGNIKVDGGGIIQVDGAPFVDYALLGQVETDDGAIRFAFYDCSSGQPKEGMSTLTDGGIEVATETISLSCTSVAVSDDVYAFKYWVPDTSALYADWFESVILPTVPAGA